MDPWKRRPGGSLPGTRCGGRGLGKEVQGRSAISDGACTPKPDAGSRAVASWLVDLPDDGLFNAPKCVEADQPA